MSVYDFTVKGADGRDVSLSEYSGRVLLIVNTATDCVFTPQYAGLQELYEKGDCLKTNANQTRKHLPYKS